jgi:hypothetical protein
VLIAPDSRANRKSTVVNRRLHLLRIGGPRSMSVMAIYHQQSKAGVIYPA